MCERKRNGGRGNGKIFWKDGDKGKKELVERWRPWIWRKRRKKERRKRK